MRASWAAAVLALIIGVSGQSVQPCKPACFQDSCFHLLSAAPFEVAASACARLFNGTLARLSDAKGQQRQFISSNLVKAGSRAYVRSWNGDSFGAGKCLILNNGGNVVVSEPTSSRSEPQDSTGCLKSLPSICQFPSGQAQQPGNPSYWGPSYPSCQDICGLSSDTISYAYVDYFRRNFTAAIAGTISGSTRLWSPRSNVEITSVGQQMFSQDFILASSSLKVWIGGFASNTYSGSCMALVMRKTGAVLSSSVIVSECSEQLPSVFVYRGVLDPTTQQAVPCPLS